MLLLIFVYIFAIAFTRLMKDSDMEPLFVNVPTSMYTLALDGVLPDLAPLVHGIGAVNPAYAAVMFIFVILSTLTWILGKADDLQKWFMISNASSHNIDVDSLRLIPEHVAVSLGMCVAGPFSAMITEDI